MHHQEIEKEIQQKTACAVTRVSRYDNYFSFLTASVIVVALLVALLFGIWLSGFDSTRLGWRTSQPPSDGLPTEMLNQVSADLDFEQPGFSEFPEAQSPRLKESLLALTHAISNLSATELVKLAGDQEEGEGTESGDKRQEEIKFVSARRRFVVLFGGDGEKEKLTRDDYFRALAHFDIYLGAVKRNSNEIHFLEKIGEEEPEVSKGDRASEKAKVLFFRNMTQPMRGWDEEKMKAHGIDIEGSLPVLFFPAEAEKLLSDLESKKLEEEGKKLEDVYKTTFQVRSKDDDFEFVVNEIEYK